MKTYPAVPAVIKKYEREILELKQELAMHDALTDRHQISYGQYSEAQKAEVRAQVAQFLQGDSSSDSLDPLQLISLRHVREVLLAARVSGQHHVLLCPNLIGRCCSHGRHLQSCLKHACCSQPQLCVLQVLHQEGQRNLKQTEAVQAHAAAGTAIPTPAAEPGPPAAESSLVSALSIMTLAPLRSEAALRLLALQAQSARQAHCGPGLCGMLLPQSGFVGELEEGGNSVGLAPAAARPGAPPPAGADVTSCMTWLASA